MKPLTITRITATPVVVPTRPDSINSPGVNDDWSASPKIASTVGGKNEAFPTIPKYLMRAETNRGLIGLGESYRAVNVDNLKRNAQALLGKDLFALQHARLPIPPDREYDGFECLVYDLLGKALDAPVYELLGGKCRDKVEGSMWTGQRTPEDAGRKAAEGKALRGYDAIKVKCTVHDDVRAWAQQIVKQAGPQMRMIFDTNQRWMNYETSRPFFESLAGFNVIGIEDPVNRDLYDDFRRLRGVGGLRTIMHVALPYCVHGQDATDTLKALALDAVDGFNFNGGMAAFIRLADLGYMAGKPCWHGSEIDLGILEASYVHAAACAPGCTWPSDIFGTLIREADLLAKPLTWEGKYVHVPQDPGLGVDLDPAAVEHYRAGEDFTLAG